MRPRTRARFPVLAAAILMLSTTTSAQRSDPTLALIQFNRSLPGARSLAMSGAFVSLADDATAAYSNPAGLCILIYPEFSAELRSWETSTRYPRSGRVTGETLNRGIDTIDGLVLANTESQSDNLSFLSYVYPSKGFKGSRKMWVLGFYKHILIDSENTFDIQGAFTSLNNNSRRLGPWRFAVDLKVENIGLSGGYAVTEDLLIGAGISHYSLDLLANEWVFDDPAPVTDEFAFPSAPGLPSAQTTSNDTDVGVNIGVLWSFKNRVMVGASYRQGPNFGVVEDPFLLPARSKDLRLPDQLAVGISYRPTHELVLTTSIEYVEYSSLLEGDFFNERLISGFQIDDVIEFRLGGEFALASGALLRAGYWLDPDHRVSYTGSPEGVNGGFRAALFPDIGTDEDHYSFGIGIARSRFQVDTALDHSRGIQTLSVSFVLRDLRRNN